MGTRIVVTGGGTGGHLYPALNLAAALRGREPTVELLYLGSRRGLEARVLPERDLPYRLLPIHPVHRSRPWRNWRLAVGAAPALAGAARAIGELDPQVILATGSYAAAPAVAWGRLTGRALALQEQNAHPGMVTRIGARWADQLHLGFPEARERLRTGSHTAVFTYGNPVAVPDGEPTSGYDWPGGRIVLVAGGSQGAEGLNRRLLADLRDVRAWPTDLSLVWVAGRDHADDLRGEVDRLPFGERVRVESYIEELGAQLSRVSLAVCRAGAMFVSELAAAGVPAVLVPYPAAAGGHQGENARALAGAGAAVVREEAELSDGQLWRLASRLVADPERLAEMSRAARARGAPDAAGRIADEVLRLARARGGGGTDDG